MFFIGSMIVGVMAFSALLGWVLLWSATSVERAKHDPRYRKLVLLLNGVICAAGGVFCVVLLTEKQPSSQLFSSLFLEAMNLLSFINLRRLLRTPAGEKQQPLAAERRDSGVR